MKIKRIITKNYLQSRLMQNSFFDTKHKMEWLPEYQSYCIDGVTLVPLHNILEVEIYSQLDEEVLSRQETIELSKKLKKK